MRNNMIKSVLLGVALLVGVGAVKAEQKFDNFEVNFSLGTRYAVDADAAFRQAYDFNLTAGAQVVLAKYFVVEAEVPFFVHNELAVKEVAVGGLLRVPIADLVALYGGGGVIYQWNDSNYDYYAKAGAELRLIKNVGFYTEGIYKLDELNRNTAKDGNWLVAAGLRISF